MKNRAPVGRHAGRENGRATWEGGDCKLAKSAHRKPGSSCRDPNSNVKPPSASIPPPYTGRPRSAALTSLPEAYALTAGPPLAHAHGTPTAASSRWAPNRPAASRRLPPLHRGVRFSKPTAPHRGPSSKPTIYLSPGSPPRAARRAVRRLVRRAPGREQQCFLSGARL